MSSSLWPHALRMPGLPVHHQLPELTQTHVYRVGDAIQPSHPLLFPTPFAFNLSQHQGLFKWVNSSHQVAKVLEFQLQHQSFQWIFRTDFLWSGMDWELDYKKAELQRIDPFELWCWRRLLRVPWTARRSNQSILREISPECWLEGWYWSWNSSILATSCKELTHWKRPCCWEGLGAGREGDDREWDGWKASPTRYTWVWVNSGSWWWTGRPGVLWFMGLQRVGHDWATELNWIEYK